MCIKSHPFRWGGGGGGGGGIQNTDIVQSLHSDSKMAKDQMLVMVMAMMMMMMMTMMMVMTLVIFLPGDLTLECEEDAERYQLKIEESLQVIMMTNDDNDDQS